MQTRTEKALSQKLQNDVRAKVEEKIGNNRNNLTVSALSNSCLKNELQYAAEYGARTAAREIFLRGRAATHAERISLVDGKVQTYFCCVYAPEVWTEDKLISYITDPDDFAQKEVEKYLSEHQEDILLEFLMNDLLKKEYEQILVNEADPIHLIRRIMAVMSSTPAKTVNVSISKDGTELTMKVNADDLRADPGVSAMYNVWNIAAPDRREFERLFGSHAHYGPQDIAQISFGKKILYSR